MMFPGMRALFFKNLKLKLRSPFSTLMEILMPVALAAMLVYSRSKIPDMEIPDMGFLSRATPLGRFSGPIVAAPLEACKSWRATLHPRNAGAVQCFPDEASVEEAARNSEGIPSAVIFEDGKFHLRFTDANDEQLLHAQYLLSGNGEEKIVMHDAMRGSPLTAMMQQGAEAAVGMLMVVFSQSVSKFVNMVASEKENKLKELLLIHGLSLKTLYLSWIITAAAMYAVIALSVSIVFEYGNLFAKSSGLSVFLLLWSFGMSSVSLALAVSAPFRSTKIASVFSMVFYFVVSLVRTFRIAKSTVIFHLLPQVAFDRGVNILVDREYSASPKSLWLEIFFLLISTCMYFSVFVGLDSGNFRFLFFWRANRTMRYAPVSPVELGRAMDADASPQEEPLDERRRAEAMVGDCVAVKDLCVNYGSLRAVDKLSFRIFRSEVSVLLAPNGGGKSSLLKCLCGLVDSWKGDISVFGEDRLQERRRILGFCPQDDVLWPDLTVAEHLEIFRSIKSGDKAELERLVVESGMVGKKHAKVSQLSGGMKRKVNALIAFGGHFVMLDEMTTGLDSLSRRAAHEMIGKLKKDRVILLTTHFMDEAEILGERIIIMTGGKLRISGSLTFLKKQFDCGHIVTFTGERRNLAMIDFLERAKELMPSMSVKTKTQDSLAIRVSPDFVGKIPELIDLGKRYFESTSVNAAKLEEIFMHIASPALKEGSTGDTGKVREQREFPTEKDLGVDKIRQLKAELRKRQITFRRDFRSIMFMQLAPLLVVGAGVWLGNAMSSDRRVEVSGKRMRLEIVGEKKQEWEFESVKPLRGVELRCGEEDKLCQTEIAMAMMSGACVEKRGRCEAAVQIARYIKKKAEEIDGVIYRDEEGIDVYVIEEEFTKNKILAGLLKQKAEIINLPLPSEMEKYTSLAQNIAPAIYAIIGLSFFSGGAALQVVKERNAKIHTFVCGLSPSIYWIARLCVDIFMYIPVAIISVVLLRGSATFRKSELVLLSLLYGPAALGNGYLLSFFFSDGPTAQNVCLTISQLAGFMLVMAYRGLKLFDSSFPIFPLAATLSPAFLLGDGLVTIVLNHYLNTEDSLVQHLLLLLLYAVVSICLVFGVEQMRGDLLWRAVSFFRRRRVSTYRELEELPEGRVRSLSMRGEEALVVSEVTKNYGGGRKAVDKVSLGCRIGEVYGLLGANGAGKTTLIKVCTGQIRGDSGNVKVANMDAEKTGKWVGYCAQEDLFAEDLTVEENLEVMAEIKNVQERSRDVVSRLIEELDLRGFRERRSGDLSGGNKRKLCVAMALLGKPIVSYYDEASSGMDPAARRFLWGVLKRASEETAIVLTTHLMEEAEALSSRIGIMKNGVIIAEGTMDELRKSLTTGWEATMIGVKNMQMVGETIKEEFVKTLEMDVKVNRSETQGEVKILIPSGKSEISLVFKLLDNLKNKLNLTEYYLAQLSLEAIFNELASQ